MGSVSTLFVCLCRVVDTSILISVGNKFFVLITVVDDSLTTVPLVMS